MSQQVNPQRDLSLDKHRGFAIIIMVIFHAAYDLDTFKFVDIDFGQGFWYWFPRFIAFNFLFCVGISLQKAYKNTIGWSKFWQRFGKIAGAALVISIITYFMFPKSWIYFGTLHCIALSSLLGLYFVNKPYLSLSLSIGIIIFMLVTGIDIPYLSTLLIQPSMDFIPIYPWFFAPLLGIFYEMKSPSLLRPIWNLCPSFFALLGRYSLRIYILHQPILFGLCYLLYKAVR